MHSYVREVLLSWGGFLVGKKGKRLGILLIYAFLGPSRGKEIGELFRILLLIDQKKKKKGLREINLILVGEVPILEESAFLLGCQSLNYLLPI